MRRSAAGCFLLAGLVALPPAVACAQRRGSARFTVSTVAVGQQPIAVGRGPWGIAVGDLNRDGKPDVVTANSEGNGVSVLLAR